MFAVHGDQELRIGEVDHVLHVVAIAVARDVDAGGRAFIVDDRAGLGQVVDDVVDCAFVARDHSRADDDRVARRYLDVAMGTKGDAESAESGSP